TLGNATLSYLTFYPPAPGEYQVDFAASENFGSGSFVHARKTIVIANLPPTIYGFTAPTQAGTDSPVSSLFTVSSDAGGGGDLAFATLSWTVLQNNRPSTTGRRGASFTFPPSQYGQYLVTVKVPDRDGAFATAHATVVVGTPQPAPAAHAVAHG